MKRNIFKTNNPMNRIPCCRPILHYCRLVFLVLLAPVLSIEVVRAEAVDPNANPLKPIDTSGPRSTFQGFTDSMSLAHGLYFDTLFDYLKSGDLYAKSTTLSDRHAAFISTQEAAERTLDLSELPPAMAAESSRRLVIQLKEVLDRLELPPPEAIPDAKVMTAAGQTRWVLPNTEIRIARVEKGPRAGEFLFDAETVSRIPDFYEKVRHLPNRTGAPADWYDWYTRQPIALAYTLRTVIPPRWLLEMPAWTRGILLNQPIWRWVGLMAVTGLAGLVVLGCFRLTRGIPHGNWRRLLRPVSVMVVSPVTAFVLSDILRVSSPVYEWVTLSLICVLYLALAWMVWSIGGVLAESVIASERLRVGSIDSQLIRLVIRLITVIVVVFILVTGADRLGLPAYSVVAGLGVGGLAFALAAQQTLANLIGSLIIMFEKPFVTGNTIAVKGIQGKVESVGFRSTRIRTSQHSVVTIPSSDLVNSTIDNLDRRSHRRIQSHLRLPADTPGVKLDAFLVGVRGVLEADPHTVKSDILVELHDFGPGNLDILVSFNLKVPDGATESGLRHEILRAIFGLAEEEGVTLV
jgi:MscS family membrane protein